MEKGWQEVLSFIDLNLILASYSAQHCSHSVPGISFFVNINLFILIGG